MVWPISPESKRIITTASAPIALALATGVAGCAARADSPSMQAPGALADLVAANLDAPVEEKAQLIETVEVKDRIRKVLRLLTRQLEILKMRERINSQIKE